MIQHIVLFKLKDPTEDTIGEAARVLRSMENKVPQIEEIVVGTDFLHSPRSCDLGLMVKVKDRAALDAYQNDPYHVGVVKKHMHAVRKSSVSLDFEL